MAQEKDLTLTEYLDEFYKGENTTTLTVNNYCSEVIDKIEEFVSRDGLKLLIANPGLGKSVMVVKLARNRKVLFLAPTISIATQMADEYYIENNGTKMATLLCSNVKGYVCNEKQDSNLVIAVYDSLSKIETMGIDLSEYTIFLDEIHQTVLATTYRQSAIDTMEKMIGKNYVSLTATPYSLMANEFSHILHIKSINDKQRTVRFYKKDKHINTNEYVSYIANQVKGKCIVLCNNSKNAEDVSYMLSDIGRKCLVVDANNNKHHREKIVKTKMFPENVDTIITTEALSDGVSLYDKDITDMILMKQNINLNHLIQFPARARKSNPIVHYILAENRGKSEQIKEDINFNINNDKDVYWILEKTKSWNDTFKKNENSDKQYTKKQLQELFKHNRRFNKYIMNGELYTINNNLLSVDFFTRDDKLVNKVVIELFRYYGYNVEYIESIKRENKETKKEDNKGVIKYKDIDKQDKVNMVMSSLTHIDMNTNNDLDTNDYKKEINTVINKVKTILNKENIEPMESLMLKDKIELAIDLPNNFVKLANIKRALDVLNEYDDFNKPFNTLVNEIKEKGYTIHKGEKIYFIEDGKYISKEQQNKIEEIFMCIYNDSVKGKFHYDTFMKCVFKVQLSEDRKTTKIIGVLGKGELYLQGQTIKLY